MNTNRPNNLKPLFVQRPVQDRSRQAFTLTELLVVVATLGILAVLLLPALASSTQPGSAKAYQCLNNMRQMVVAWTLYSEDNHDWVVNNFGIAETQSEISGRTYRNWVNDIMSWSISPPNDQMTNLDGITKAPFNAYLSGKVAYYKCPADNYLSPIQVFAGYTSRPRSYSMNAFFGAYNPTYTSTGNSFFPSFRQFLKMSAVPNPANIYVMLEEHPDSINDGYFLNNANPNIATWPSQNWNDLPGSNHTGASGFSFADGHSEIHKWNSYKCTILAVKMQADPLYPFSTDKANAYADAQWLALRSSVPR
ncbi:MAG: prepilin-type N-terminal cleavage/methylation domain-containing protein [Verrucomicrobiia bacterium]